MFVMFVCLVDQEFRPGPVGRLISVPTGTSNGQMESRGWNPMEGSSPMHGGGCWLTAGSWSSLRVASMGLLTAWRQGSTDIIQEQEGDRCHILCMLWPQKFCSISCGINLGQSIHKLLLREREGNTGNVREGELL